MGGRTNDEIFEILIKVLSKDNSFPRVNTRLKGKIVIGDNEIGKELKYKLKMEWKCKQDEWEEWNG